MVLPGHMFHLAIYNVKHPSSRILTFRCDGAIVTLVDSSTCNVRLLATMRGSQYQAGNTRMLNIPSVVVPPALTRNL